MRAENLVLYTSVILSFSAGYLDATTWTCVDKMFAAHITGNFVVFAYDILKHADMKTWLRLLAFPVFIAGAIIAAKMEEAKWRMNILIHAEGIILVLAGIAAVVAKATDAVNNEMHNFSIALMVVFAMAFQNAFGKLFPKAVYGITTSMTGNVTQIILDSYHLMHSGDVSAAKISGVQNMAKTVGSFLLGCAAGIRLSSWVGLPAILLPAVLIVLLGVKGEQK